MYFHVHYLITPHEDEIKKMGGWTVYLNLQFSLQQCILFKNKLTLTHIPFSWIRSPPPEYHLHTVKSSRNERIVAGENEHTIDVSESGLRGNARVYLGNIFMHGFHG